MYSVMSYYSYSAGLLDVPQFLIGCSYLVLIFEIKENDKKKYQNKIRRKKNEQKRKDEL